MPVRELVVVAALGLWALGAGRAIQLRLDREAGEGVDVWAIRLLLGLGVLTQIVLGLGLAGWLNGVSIGAAMAAVGLVAAIVSRRLDPGSGPLGWRRGGLTGGGWAARGLLAMGLAGTLLTALAPVTDGDALCYHLQVPKVFLERSALVYEPDLHETVYPLVVELLYVPALVWGGPVACRLVTWLFGVALTAVTVGLARPVLGRRADWAGVVVLLAPAVSNGMSAPLNDVPLAAACAGALWAVVRWRESPGVRRALQAGLLSGLALGVKYPALVWVAVLGGMLLVWGWRRSGRELAAAGLVAVVVGGPWYVRAALSTGNPVHPYFRHLFGGAGLDEVLEPAKRPLAVTPLNLLTALAPLTLEPDRFDSVSHQFGPVYLALLPGLMVLRPPRPVVGLTMLGMVYVVICLTQRQSMRFLLPALGPWSVAAAWVGWEAVRRSRGAGAIVGVLILGVLGGEAALSVARARHGMPVLLGQESVESYLARREPTYVVGRWMAANLPESARVIGQDHRGFYLTRPYTMELAHRRRTGLTGTAEDVVRALRARGFTHLLLCPPVPEDAVEFDPTMSRLLAAWLERARPQYRSDLRDADGVVRRYAVYALEETAWDRLAGGPTP